MDAHSWTKSSHISKLLMLFSDPPHLPGLRPEEALFQKLIELEEEAARANVPKSTLELIANVRRTAGKAALSIWPTPAASVRGQ